MSLQSNYDPGHAFEILNSNGAAEIILICEHASNYIPPEYNNLGLTEDFLTRHIAWDIGMGDLTRKLSHRLNAPAITAGFSRLLIDPNREEDHETLIPLMSDGILIPGNQKLSQEETQYRKDKYYHAFHDQADLMVKDKIQAHKTPLICGMHSFTPRMTDKNRPWHAGMLWNKDPRLAHALINSLSARGFQVGNNEPYSGRDLFFTMNYHGGRHGFPHVTIEIRQDEINTPDGIDRWVDILAHDLSTILNKGVING